MAERNPKDINKKLRGMTKDQAKALAGDMNSAYGGKKKAAKKTDSKKSGK